MASAKEVLADADVRLEWAEQHVAHFEREIQGFHQADGYAMAKKIHPEGNEVIVATDPPPIPPQLVLIAVDAIHNARVALDYLACALAIANSRTTKNVYFPVAASVDEFGEPTAQRKIKKLSPAAKAFIARLHPYKGGNALLYALHDADRVDKHLRLEKLTEAPPQLYFTVSDGIEDASEALDSGDRVTKYDLAKIAVNPGFGQVIPGFEGETALTLLKEFLKCVATILADARAEFFPNTQRVATLTNYSVL